VIVEREVRERVAQRYYPELYAALMSDVRPGIAPDVPFDFRAEMRKTPHPGGRTAGGGQKSRRLKPTWKRAARCSSSMAT
jgi:hypothetical protein